VRRCVKQSLLKAKEFALLAVKAYNDPATKMRSARFIVLMHIAWTYLFHAYFFSRGIKPIYTKGKRKSGRGVRYQRIDKDYRYWELAECVRQYFKDQNPPMKENLRLLIKLRRKVEHTTQWDLSDIDAQLFGELQANLLNFGRLLEQFSDGKFSIRDHLYLALQTGPYWTKEQRRASRPKDAQQLLDFLNNFRSSLSQEVWDSEEYSFRVFLVKMTGNPRKDAVAVEFIREEDMATPQDLQHLNVLIRERTIPVANRGYRKPKQVVEEVNKRLRGENLPRFNMHHHTQCWKMFKVRPPAGSKQPRRTRPEFCVYDEPNGDYLYTEAWVKKLVKYWRDLHKPDAKMGSEKPQR